MRLTVLPLWPESFELLLTPSRVALVKHRGRGRPQVLPLPSGVQGFPATGQPVADFVAGLLPRVPKAKVSVLLSNSLMHFLRVPWCEGLRGEEELRQYVLHHFIRQFGDSARHWEVCWSLDRQGRHFPAAAMDLALLGGIRAGVAAAGLSLTTLVPFFMAAFNGWSGRQQGRRCWFMVLEPEGLLLALVDSEGWQWLRFVRLRAGELPIQVLERELCLAGMSLGGSLVICTAGRRFDPVSGDIWQVEWLQPGPGQSGYFDLGGWLEGEA